MFNTNQRHNGNSEVFATDSHHGLKKEHTPDKDQSQFDQITSAETRGSFPFCEKPEPLPVRTLDFEDSRSYYAKTSSGDVICL